MTSFSRPLPLEAATPHNRYPALTVRQVAILRYVWKLTSDERAWLEDYYILRSTVGDIRQLESNSPGIIVYQRQPYVAVHLEPLTSYPARTTVLVSCRRSREQGLYFMLVRVQPDISTHICKNCATLVAE